MNSSGRFQSAKNLQPARSLRTTVKNRNGPGNFGLTHEQVGAYQAARQQAAGARQGFAGSNCSSSTIYSTNSSSNGYKTNNGYSAPKAAQRRHDVLRSPNTSFGSNASSHSGSSSKEIQTIVTFSSTTLSVGSMHEVYISYVENGPKLFSVQLKADENALNQMMRAIETIPLRNLSRKPTLGMACIARFSEDQMLYRALIMGINVDSCRVSFVDYGNAETVEFKNLYEIPKEFLKHKVFSMRFTLSNVKTLFDTNADIEGIFSTLVLDKLLNLKAMPLEGPAFVQYCELYENNENIFDKLLALCKSQRLKYPAAITLDRGTNSVAIIRYIESCRQFYVQPEENIERFESMMDQLAEFCHKSTTLNVLTSGDPCAACLRGDEWYRAEIVSATGEKVKVRLVDYGNTITVERNQIKRLNPEFVEQKPQVVECCLEGFQDIGDDNLSTAQLEMLSENDIGDRRQFKLIVTDIANGLIIVNLFDESNTPVLNVSKRLLKLKNPAKFIKAQQQQQQGQQKLSANTKPFQSGQYGQQQQQPQLLQSQQPYTQSAAPQITTGNSRNLFLSTTSISEVTNISQTTPPRMAETEVIDLTNDDWVSVNAQPLGYQSSTYEDQHNPNLNISSTSMYSTASNRTTSGGYRNESSSRGNARNDNYSSNRDYNSNQGSGKKERFQRTDIPRFNKERNQIPYYVEHDDRCEDTSSYDHHQVQDNRRDKSGPKSRTNTSGSESGFNTQSAERPSDSFKSSASSVEVPVEDYVHYEFKYPTQIVPMNTQVDIKLSWWVSPEEFYVRMKDEENKYEDMMKQIQKFYKNKHPIIEVAPVGAAVIARHQKHNTFYRANVLKYNESLNKFKVELTDCGNKSIVSDLWRLEKRFTKLPKMAIQCTLANIKLNCDVKELQNRIDKYVDNEQPIVCTFLEQSEDKYLCEVESKGADLKMALLKDNLIAQILTDIDLNRLKGQTIKLKLVEMKGLEHFRVKVLGSDAILNCRHVEHAAYEQSIVEEIQSKVQDQYCFGQVEDVSSDERLILTLLVPPLSNQTVPTIVDMPILENKFTVLVTCVHETNCVYVQNVKWSAEVGKLLDDLYEHYEKSGEVITNLQMDELCASKASDGNWYRSKIVSLQEIDNIEVLFVDYGNRERVKHEDLKVLEPQFCEYSAFANKVYLPMTCLNDGEERKLKLEISALTESYELECTVLEYRNDVWIVDIASNDYSIVQVLKDKQLVKDLDHEEILNQKSATVCESVVDVTVPNKPEEQQEGGEPRNQAFKAYVSHVDNPNQLFIQMDSDQEDLDQLQENLQIISTALPSLKDFSVNKHCIAPYSADDLWYRARIIDSHDDLIIQFVDYGNSDVITSNKKSDLKDVNESLMNFKIYAKQCSLLVLPPGGKKNWNEDATSILRELQEIEVQFLAECQGVHYINLKADDRDLAEELIAKQLAVKMEYVQSGQHCFTSHIESIREFYLQLEKNVNALDVMTDYMARFEEFPIVDQPQVGSIYVAQFIEDDLWYRARILKALPENEFEAFFLDYGNTSLVKNVRTLEKAIADLPPLCTKCTLRLPEGVKMWSDEAEEKFQQIAAMGETVFTVQLHTPGSVATVDLFIEDSNIRERLMDLCEKGTANVMNESFFLNEEKTLDDSFPSEGYVFVSHVNSPADFYIQFKNSFDALKNMEELLMANAPQCDKLSREEICEGMYCLAYLDSYDKYYRAQIMCDRNQQMKVHLIDYGFTSFASELRKMPRAIEEISLLAKKCCLEMYTPHETVLDVVQKRFSVLTDAGRAQFSFEIVRNDSEPNIIRLFTKDGRNVEDLLECDDSRQLDATNNNEAVCKQTISAEAPPPLTAAELTKTARAKPKQAFFRAKSDLEFEQ